MANYTPTGVPVTRSRPLSAEIRNEFGLIAAAIATKQDALVSGTSLRTVNGVNLLGSGNVAITKTDVGLANVDNTADADKPISTAVSAALAGKQATLVSGSSIRTINGNSLLGSGDITITPGTSGVTSVNGRSGAVSLTAADVGLGSVNNTADADKPISTATATALANKADAAATTSALAGKQATLVSGSNIRTVNGNSLLGSGDVTITATGGVTSVNTRTGAVTLTAADVGLGSVNNTSDAAKPVSTATQTALNAKLSLDGSTPMTGQFRSIDGTAAAPGMAFANALNFGFYRIGTSIGIAINGVSRFLFDSGLIYVDAPAGTYSTVRSSTSRLSLEDNALRIDENDVVRLGLSDTANTDLITSRTNGIAFNRFAIGRFDMRSAQTTNIGFAGNAGTVLAFYSDNGSASVSAGGISVSGNTTSYGTSSDARLKRDIVPAGPALALADEIQVRSFSWADSGDHVPYGFIAQELRGVCPEAVVVPDDPEKMMSVDPGKLVPMLTKMVQELKARVEALEEVRR